MSFSGDTYLSFGISILLLASLFCNSLEVFFETLIETANFFLPIKSPVASAVCSF